MVQSMAEKRVIITGAARGIGAASVDGFVAAGASVAALDIQFAEAERDTHDVFKSYVDVGSVESVQDALARSVDHLGGLDVLIHVAGIEIGGASDEIPDDDWDAVFTVNTKGTRNVNVAALPFMKAKGGSMINFGSRSGVVGVPRQAAYSASKAAVHAWTRAVAQEWARYSITVNAIAPAMWTDMYEEFRARLSTQELTTHDAERKAQIPLGGKLGDPQEHLVPVLLFLASDGARFITGQTIPVDGGWLQMR